MQPVLLLVGVVVVAAGLLIPSATPSQTPAKNVDKSPPITIINLRMEEDGLSDGRSGTAAFRLGSQRVIKDAPFTVEDDTARIKVATEQYEAILAAGQPESKEIGDSWVLSLSFDKTEELPWSETKVLMLSALNLDPMSGDDND